MPVKPLKPCNKVGCGQLTRDTYCDKHKQDKHYYDKHRSTPAQRGYGSRWLKYSRAYRSRNPICVMCRQAPSEHVDHIAPVNGPNDPLFWVSTNHQALCHSCHSKKTAKEDGGFGNKRKG